MHASQTCQVRKEATVTLRHLLGDPDGFFIPQKEYLRDRLLQTVFELELERL